MEDPDHNVQICGLISLHCLCMLQGSFPPDAYNIFLVYGNKAVSLFSSTLRFLTLLHSEGPKLHRVLAILNAIGLMSCYLPAKE